ncbi:ABC transporter permease [Candidatus Solirubrobacter pratensis]|uniref:ABC transporter permease n=1 Tax=Candidatus Solirubrobacter pratensis TaxID=1298857 RepID=UPI000409E968|nr:ABC transporter permease [Candidatus Solirubrobacter pratensis]
MADSLVFVGRSVRHSARSLDAVMTAVLLPVMILLLFVYVFGGAIDTGGRYVDYVVPGIILLCAGYGSATTAVSVNQDMTTGVIDRFRSLPISSSGVLTGHVVASVLRNLVSTVIVLCVALLIGFDPRASALDWLGVLGVLLAFMVAISWIAACFGLLAKSAEGAGAFSFAIMFLPYVSSAFVPTDSMPAALEAIGDRQPITPIVETLRGLMLGTPIGDHAVAALAWCGGLTALGVISAGVLFRRAA